MTERDLAVCVTFDLDLADYAGDGGFTDEFDGPLQEIVSILDERDVKATFFVRVDDEIGARFGRADHAFVRYADRLAELQQRGHEIGWHPHCAVEADGKWQQNTDGMAVARELARYAPMLRARGIDSVRMGWGFHTNDTLQLLAGHGFRIDSSAIPRPRYAWEQSQKDWDGTPKHPYAPSASDYRIPGQPALDILEIPMSVESIPAPYDSEPVVRYINLAFHAPLLREPLTRWIAAHDHLVTITHPYEAWHGREHALIAFHPDALRQNLDQICAIAQAHQTPARFMTIRELARTKEASHGRQQG